VLADYVCKVMSGDPKAADDATRVDWFRIDKLGDLLLTAGTREVIEKAFALTRAPSKTSLAGIRRSRTDQRP